MHLARSTIRFFLGAQGRIEPVDWWLEAKDNYFSEAGGGHNVLSR